MRARFCCLLLAACGPALQGESVGMLADRCQDCHPLQAEAHAASRHAKAGRSVVFKALRTKTSETLGASFEPFCDGCHLPEPGNGDGLSCITCHAARGNFGTNNGLLAHDLNGPVRGPKLENSQAPHATFDSGFLKSPDLCGTCHEVDGPRGFKESPFTHYLEGPAAQAGLRCQDCHMGSVPGDPEGPRARGMAARFSGATLEERSLSTHRIIGPDDSAQDRAGLLGRGIELDILAVDASGVDVQLKSAFGGHRFMDGASFLRGIWLELRVDGAEVLAARRSLSAELYKEGAPVALPTDADEVRFFGLSAGESRQERLEAQIPSVGQGAAQVEVCVRFQRYRDEVVEALSITSQVPQEALVPVDVVCAQR